MATTPNRSLKFYSCRRPFFFKSNALDCIISISEKKYISIQIKDNSNVFVTVLRNLKGKNNKCAFKIITMLHINTILPPSHEL